MTSYHNAKRPDKAKANRVLERAGYNRGGRVSDEEQDEKTAGAAVHKHEKRLHRGEKETKFKDGGRVFGEKSKERLDRKARGGKVSNAMGEAHKVTQFPRKKLNEEPHQIDSEGMKKYDGDGYARGGRAKGKGKGHTSVNINLGGQQGAGGADPQQAFKAGVLQGAQAAKAAIAGGVQHGAPMMPPGGGMPPGGAPAPGGMPPGGAPMGGPPGMPPRQIPPGGPPMMRKSGGRVGSIGHPVGGTLPLAEKMNSGSGGGKGRLTKAGFYQGKK